MNITFPPPPGQYVPQFMTNVLSAIRIAFADVAGSREAVAHVILRSPNGTTYNVTVDDGGSLIVTANPGKSRE